jgi:hypothetical protein
LYILALYYIIAQKKKQEFVSKTSFDEEVNTDILLFLAYFPFIRKEDWLMRTVFYVLVYPPNFEPVGSFS